MTTNQGRVPNPVAAPPAGASAVSYHQAPNGAPMAYAPQVAPQVVYIPEQRKRTSHGLHVLLCFLTGGLWIPVYLIIALSRS